MDCDNVADYDCPNCSSPMTKDGYCTSLVCLHYEDIYDCQCNHCKKERERWAELTKARAEIDDHSNFGIY